MIRLVVSDVDGTIMDESERMPEKIIQLADLIRQKNILFTFASGREYSQLTALEEILGIEVPVILCNGTAAKHKGKFCWCEAIHPMLVKKLVEKADHHNMTVILSLPEGEFAYRKTEFVEQTIRQYGRFGNVLALPDGDWSRISVQKILVIDREKQPEFSALTALADGYGNHLTYVNFGNSMDIVPKGCTKAAGIRRLAALLEIDMAEIMAIGDGLNDIEMVQEAGVGAAVHNAAAELKQHADYVCTEDYIDGVMEAIRKYC